MPKIEHATQEDRLLVLLAEARAVAVGEYQRAEAEKNRADRYRRALEKVTEDARAIVEGADAIPAATLIVQRGMGALPWGESTESSETGVRETVEVHPADGQGNG